MTDTTFKHEMNCFQKQKVGKASSITKYNLDQIRNNN